MPFRKCIGRSNDTSNAGGVRSTGFWAILSRELLFVPLLPSREERARGRQDCGFHFGRTDYIKGERDCAASLIMIKNMLKESLAFSIVINELFNFRL